MIVREVMAQPVVVVREDTTLDAVARTMLERRIGYVPVVNERGALSGLVTESDFAPMERGFPFSPFSMYRHLQVLGRWLTPEGVERIYREARTMTARDIMRTDVATAEEDEPIEEVLRRMLRREVHGIPVVRDGVPIGIVVRRDLLLMLL